MTRTLRDKAQYNYCPLCGQQVEKEEVPVSSVPGTSGESITTRTNLVVRCPNHGELIHQ